MKKVSSKILFIMIGCCIFVSLLIGGFSLYQGSKFIRAEASEKLLYIATSYANEFSQSLEKTEGYVDSLHSSVLASFDMKAFRSDPAYTRQYEQIINDIMSKYASNNNDAFGMYFTFNPEYSHGEFIEIWYEDFKRTGILERITSTTNQEYPDIFLEGWTYPCTTSFDRNEEGMKFLYATIDAENPLWFKPYQEIGLAKSTLSDVTVISYVMPIIIDQTTIGVVGMDYNFNEIEKTIKGMSVYKGGYAVLLDENYQILVRPNSMEDTKGLDEIGQMIKQNSKTSSGTFEYDRTGADEIIGYSRLVNGWTLALIQPRSEIYKPAWELSLFIALLAFLSIVISVFIASRFTRTVSQRLDSVTDQLRYTEIGDFNKEIPKELLKSNDDLGYFIKSVHTMQTIIEEEVQKNRQKDAEMLYQSRYAKMGEMIGNIAHQWRQPLNSLATILCEMKDAADHNDLSPDHFETSLRKSNQIIQSMSQTINDFRDFLSPSKQKTLFSIHGAVSFAVNLMEESLRSNNIFLSIDLVADTMAYGFENEFSQVISNILNNAKDALGETEDKKRVIRICIDTVEQYARIAIFNNGRQIPPDIKELLFTAYHTTKTVENGTGIGLYMSKIIIEEHMNGKIDLENVEDGVCCSILIPGGEYGK